MEELVPADFADFISPYQGILRRQATFFISNAQITQISL